MDLKPGQVPLIDRDDPPDWTRPEWFTDCPNTPHIDEPLHHGRLMLASRFVLDAVEDCPRVRSVADFGAGDGGLLQQLLPLKEHYGVDLWGYDLARPSIEAAAARGVDVSELNVIDGSPNWPDLVVVTEFLEHLVDPFSFVARARPESPYIVASSPFTETLEAHYPLHCWAFDLDGYKSLIEDAGYEVIRQETVDMFQVVLGRWPEWG